MAVSMGMGLIMRRLIWAWIMMLGVGIMRAQVTPGVFPAASVRSVAVHEATGTYYAGTYGGGVFSSSDGISWSRITPANMLDYINCIEVGQNGELLVAAANKAAVSRDHGVSWQILLNIESLSIKDAVFSSGEHVYLVGTQGSGLIKCSENGLISEPLTTTIPVSQVRSILWHVSLPDRIIIGSQNGIILSENAGSTWTFKNNGLNKLFVRVLSYDPQNPNRLFVSIQDSFASVSSGGTIYRSQNSGDSWTKIFEEVCLTDIAIDPASPATVAATSYYSGVIISNENGDPGTWVPMNSGLPGLRVYDIEFSSGKMVAGTSFGFYKNDGSFWMASNSGMNVPNIRSLSAFEGGSAKIIAGC
ncbi:hypothetical protein JW979_01170, partial [bacterium]|nr:hypothetical protein [candidate division CSSED10-310 bacterium]